MNSRLVEQLIQYPSPLPRTTTTDILAVKSKTGVIRRLHRTTGQQRELTQDGRIWK
jgi:hypothetical protein